MGVLEPHGMCTRCVVCARTGALMCAMQLQGRWYGSNGFFRPKFPPATNTPQ